MVAALASRAASHASLDDPSAVALLLGELRAAGAPDERHRLAGDPASLDEPMAVAQTGVLPFAEGFIQRGRTRTFFRTAKVRPPQRQDELNGQGTAKPGVQ